MYEFEREGFIETWWDGNVEGVKEITNEDSTGCLCNQLNNGTVTIRMADFSGFKLDSCECKLVATDAVGSEVRLKDCPRRGVNRHRQECLCYW